MFSNTGFIAELLAADGAEIGAGQREGGGRGSDGGQLADRIDRISTQRYLCHSAQSVKAAEPPWARVVRLIRPPEGRRRGNESAATPPQGPGPAGAGRWSR